MKDGVGLRRDRGVGALCDQARAYPSRVYLGDLILHGGRDEHRDRQLEELGIGHRVGLLEPAHATAHLPVLV